MNATQYRRSGSNGHDDVDHPVDQPIGANSWGTSIFQARHEQAPWLAEGVPAIVPFDADFAAEIYAVLFGRPAPQEGKSWLGGQRIKNGCRVRRTTRILDFDLRAGQLNHVHRR